MNTLIFFLSWIFFRLNRAFPISTRYHRAFSTSFTPVTIYNGIVPVKDVILLSTYDGGLQEINVQTGDLEYEYLIGQRHVKQADFLLEVPFKNQLLTSDNKNIKLWDVSRRELIYTQDLTDFLITSWCFDRYSEDRVIILTTSFDIKSYNINNKLVSNILTQPQPITRTIIQIIITDPNILVLSLSDYRVITFNIMTSSYGDSLVGDTSIPGHTTSVRYMAYISDSKKLITAGYDKLLIIWDYTTKKPIKQFTDFSANINSLLHIKETNSILVATTALSNDNNVFHLIDGTSLDREMKLSFDSTSLSGITRLFYLPKEQMIIGHIGFTVGYFIYNPRTKSVDRMLYSYANAKNILYLPDSTLIIATYTKPFSLKSFDLLKGNSPQEIPILNSRPELITTSILYIPKRNSIVLAFSNSVVILLKNSTFEKEAERNFAAFGDLSFFSIDYDQPSGYLLILGLDVIVSWNPDTDDTRSKALTKDNSYRQAIVIDELFIINSSGGFFRLKIRTLEEVQNSQGSLGKKTNRLLYWKEFNKILFVGPYNTVEWINCGDYSQTGLLTTDSDMAKIDFIDFLFEDENLIIYYSNWLKVFDYRENKQVFSQDLVYFGLEKFQMLTKFHIVTKIYSPFGFLLMNLFCLEATSIFSCKRCSTSATSAYPCQTCEEHSFMKTNLGVCQSCSDVCQTCFDSHNTTCLTCTNDFFWESTSSKACVQKSSCGSQLYPDKFTLTCEKCSRSCYNCTGPGSANCSSCQAPLYFDSEKKICSSSCPLGYFGDNVSQICLSCSLGCKECFTVKLCISCKDSYPFLLNGTCFSKCPEGFVPNPTRNSCILLARPTKEEDLIDINIVTSMLSPSEAFIYFSSPIMLSLSDQTLFLSNVVITIEGIESIYFSYVWSFINKQNIRMSFKFSKNIRKPELKVLISGLNSFLITNEDTQSPVVFKQEEYLLTTYLPQFILEETKNKSLELTEQINIAINSQLLVAGASVGVTSLFIKPIAFLWGLVDAAQYIYMLLYLNIEYPENMLKFFNNFGSLNLEFIPNIGRGTIDIAAPNIEYAYFGVHVENQIAPQNFRKYGKSSNFLLNSSSMILLVLGLYFFYILLRLAKLKIHSKKITGKIKELVDKLLGAFEYEGISRVNQIVFNQVALSICLQYNNPDFSSFCFNILGLIFGFLFVVYFFCLFLLIFRISNNFNLILDWNNPLSALFQDFNYDNMIQRTYFEFVFIKKFLICFFLVIFHSQPDVCLFSLFLTQLLHINIALYRPWFLNPLNYLEAFCEILMAVILIFIRAVLSVDSANRELPIITSKEYATKTNIGWAVIGTFACFLTIYFFVMLYGIYFSIKAKIIPIVSEMKNKSCAKSFLICLFKLNKSQLEGTRRQLSISKSGTIIDFPKGN